MNQVKRTIYLQLAVLADHLLLSGITGGNNSVSKNDQKVL